jgi:hypothetical protein
MIDSDGVLTVIIESGDDPISYAEVLGFHSTVSPIFRMLYGPLSALLIVNYNSHKNKK